MFDKDSDHNEKDVFSRRSFLLGALQAGLLSVVAGRLIYLGVGRSAHYQTLAKGNRLKLQVTLPERAQLLDRQGRVLAANQLIYRLLLQPEGRPYLTDIYPKLKANINLEAFSLKDLLEIHRTYPQHLPLSLKEPLTWEEVCRLEMMLVDIPYIVVEKGQRRFYPVGEIGAPITGYVQLPTEKDNIEPSLMAIADFRLGREGLEKAYDQALQGKAGFREIEVNATRRIQRILSVQPGQAGADIQTTLDLSLQKKVYDLLKVHQGAVAVAVNIHTGDIETLVSYPSYDPNLFTEGISHTAWKKLNNNPHGALTNKAIKGLYAPGSLFKMVVALAGLQAKKITPKTQVFCQGYIEINSHRFHCHHRHGHGDVHLEKAIAESCDVYFYELSKQIGIDRISSMAHRLGLGNKHSVVLPGEKKGLIPTKEWVRSHYERPWTVADTILTSIGQGFVLATPLQMVMLMASLANGKHMVKPRLTTMESVKKSFLDIDRSYLKLIQEALCQVVNGPTGTARQARFNEVRWQMAGKTATSQVRRISKWERENRVLRNDEIEWKKRDHAIFSGYAPADNPRYACVVLIEHGGSGSQAAAPIARDILSFLLKRDEHA